MNFDFMAIGSELMSTHDKYDAPICEEIKEIIFTSKPDACGLELSKVIPH